MKISSCAVVPVLLFALCAGCAPELPPGPARMAPDDPVLANTRAQRCFRVGDIDSWQVIDDRQLVVFGRRHEQAWQLRLFGSCIGLDFAETLGFRAVGTDLVCGDPGDELLSRERRCPIAAVRALSPADVKILLDGDVHEDIGKPPSGDASRADGK